MSLSDEGDLVRSRLWIWGHPEGSYNGPQWGLPRDSRITPLEAAVWMGIPNVIVVHYGDKPELPLRPFAIPLQSAASIMWSIVGGGGRTDEQLQEAVYALAGEMPNLTGVFMDDFFHFRGAAQAQWLAAPHTEFPVLVEITLPSPRQVSRIELLQSDAPGGGHRTAEFGVAVDSVSAGWQEVGDGTMPNIAGALSEVSFPENQIRAIRFTIYGTHDDSDADSCGLRSIRLFHGQNPVLLDDADVTTTSRYPHIELSIEERMAIADGRAGDVWADPGLYEPRCIVEDNPAVAASLSPTALAGLRSRLNDAGTHLELGVALYDYQLDAPSIVRHLDLVDLVILWHWQPKDLQALPANLSRLKQLLPTKRVMIGCYMWDFQAGREMPIEVMEYQCSQGLEWLLEGEIDGMVFLASNLCDLDLPTVDWTKQWIAEHADRPLSMGSTAS